MGRKRERTMLEEAVAWLGEGVGGLFLVGGDAGVGKSTLVEAVLASTDLLVVRGNAQVVGRCPMVR